MAKYLVKEKSAVDNAVVEAGTVVDYTPPKGVTVSENLEPHEDLKESSLGRDSHHDEKKTVEDDKNKPKAR